ncbi:hypothetical protein [Dokdonia sp.]|uniref:hypothetical protein n=1 Tax=Dokdonia sp. TaxID=2024995 RepID=UPI003262E9AB
MKLEALKKRIKRNRLAELADEFYCDANSQIVTDLKSNGKDVYFGIQNENGTYTILGSEYTYYRMKDGNEKRILNKDFVLVLQKNAMNIGKGGEFEFINIGKQDSVWVINGKTMCAIWNTVKFLNENENE